MNNFIPFFALAGVMALTGCPGVTDTDGLDTDGTGTVDCDPDATFPATGPLSAGDYVGCAPYVGATVLSYMPQPECANATWTYDVETKGTASGVNLITYDFGGGGAGQYGEDHPMTDGSTEVNAWWDAFSAELDVVTANQVDGDNTFHACAGNNGSTLIWAYEALSVADDSREDCVVIYESSAQEGWKSDFLSYHSAADLGGCDEITEWTAR